MSTHRQGHKVFSPALDLSAPHLNSEELYLEVNFIRAGKVFRLGEVTIG